MDARHKDIDLPPGTTSVREYRVKPVTRFLVTSWQKHIYSDGSSSSVTGLVGEFDGEDTARMVADAVAKAKGGEVAPFDAPATGMDHAIFARLPSYRDENGEIVATPASSLGRPD